MKRYIVRSAGTVYRKYGVCDIYDTQEMQSVMPMANEEEARNVAEIFNRNVDLVNLKIAAANLKSGLSIDAEVTVEEGR